MLKFFSTLFTLLLCLLVWGWVSASANDVIILTSGGYRAYQEVEQGLKDAIKKDPMASRLGIAGVRSFGVSKWSRDPNFLQEFQQVKPLILFTIGTPATEFAVEKIKGVPIVYAMVTSWWRFPTRRATGVHLKISEEKLTRIFSKIAKVNSIALLCGKKWLLDKELYALGRVYNIHVYLFRIDKEHSIYDALKIVGEKGIRGLLMVPDTDVYDSPQTIRFVLEWCKKNHVLVMGLSKAYLKMGADLAVDVPFYPIGRQAWQMGKEILLGKETSMLPPQPPYEFQVLVNQQSLEREDLKPPSHFLGIPIAVVRP